jgi:hypothetical protein
MHCMLVTHYDESYMPLNAEHVSFHIMMTVHDMDVHARCVMNIHCTYMHACGICHLVDCSINKCWVTGIGGEGIIFLVWRLREAADGMGKALVQQPFSVYCCSSIPSVKCSMGAELWIAFVVLWVYLLICCCFWNLKTLILLFIGMHVLTHGCRDYDTPGITVLC